MCFITAHVYSRPYARVLLGAGFQPSVYAHSRKNMYSCAYTYIHTYSWYMCVHSYTHAKKWQPSEEGHLIFPKGIFPLLALDSGCTVHVSTVRTHLWCLSGAPQILPWQDVAGGTCPSLTPDGGLCPICLVMFGSPRQTWMTNRLHFKVKELGLISLF